MLPGVGRRRSRELGLELRAVGIRALVWLAATCLARENSKQREPAKWRTTAVVP